MLVSRGAARMVVKIRYACGHEVDFQSDIEGQGAPNARRERRLAQEQAKCPACRHDSVKVQLIATNRIRKWKPN
jgi:hypothetical protein